LNCLQAFLHHQSALGWCQPTAPRHWVQRQGIGPAFDTDLPRAGIDFGSTGSGAQDGCFHLRSIQVDHQGGFRLFVAQQPRPGGTGICPSNYVDVSNPGKADCFHQGNPLQAVKPAGVGNYHTACRLTKGRFSSLPELCQQKRHCPRQGIALTAQNGGGFSIRVHFQWAGYLVQVRLEKRIIQPSSQQQH